MELSAIEIAVAMGVVLGVGGLLGWFVHRKGESVRKKTHEAYWREEVRSAQVARDRMREEREGVEAILAHLRAEHSHCEEAFAGVQKRMAGFRDSGSGAATLVKQLEGDIAKLNRKLQKTEANRQESIRQLKTIRGTAKRAESSNQAARSSATEAVTALENRKQEVRRLSEELKRREAATAEACAVMDKLHKAVADLEARNEDRASAVRALESELARAREDGEDGVRRERADRGRIDELAMQVKKLKLQLASGKPAWLLTLPRGEADDLQAIRGLGRVAEERLNAVGVFHFSQLAGMSDDDARWVAGKIGVPLSRIQREGWAVQASRRGTRQKTGS